MSVVVAAYNESEHIGRLLESLKQQSVPALELIVVDDGSTDYTAARARAAGATVVRIEHSGPARARNIGAKRASGEILVFLDGDMVVASAFLERLTLPITRGEAVGTFSKEIFIANPTNHWARAYARIRRLAFPRLLPESFPETWANYRAVRRDCFLAAGGYDDVGYGEDMTLAPKLGALAVAAPGAICFHFNPASIHEIFENGRWIGRGHDIGQVRRPWYDNSPWAALKKGMREARTGGGLVMVPARLAYHSGLLLGFAQRRLWPHRHYK
jgi:glycosyltransferase involved in cell wall biosynthesis